MNRRLLITTHAFLPEIGGTEIYTAQLAHAVEPSSWTPTVYAQMPRGRWIGSSVEQEITVRRFYTPPLLGRLRGLIPPRVFRSNRKWSPGMLPVSIYRDFDVIYAVRENVFPSDVLLWHKSRGRLRVPLVFFPLSLSGLHPPPPRVDPYYTSFLPRVLGYADLLHTCTTLETEEFAAMGYPRSRIRQLPLGLEDHEFESLPDGDAYRREQGLEGRVILYVGGLFYNKRFDLLLDALDRLGPGHEDVTVWAVGRVGDRVGRSWKDRARRHYGNRVRFAGVVPRSDLLRAFAAADVFCLPSDFEGFGMVTVEALASGKPFVACATGVAPELAELGFGRTGPVGDADALAENLRFYLDRPAEAARAGTAARAYVMRELRWSRLGRRYAELFDEAAALRR